MPRSITYGIGQYRFNPTFHYIDNEQIFDGSKYDTEEECFISYYQNSLGRIDYQDILLSIQPLVEDDATGSSNWLQYGKTYYMELTVPQHRQYDIYLNLKLCAGVNNTVDTERFQTIKQLIVPPTPQSDDFSNRVILFEDPTNITKIRACVLDEDHVLTTEHPIFNQTVPDDKRKHEVYSYKNEDNGLIEYWYVTKDPNNSNNSADYVWKKISNRTIGNLTQGWKVNKTDENGDVTIDVSKEYGSTITFKFAFSPKFNLTGGFPYLLLESDRTGNENHILEYIGEDGVTYHGTCLDIKQVYAKIYAVSNLLLDTTNGLSQIQTGTTVNHIAVWGHPEQILTINGEEIKIGKSGFYELKDFDISSLGIVVEGQDVQNSSGQSTYVNNTKDTFTIDYEYKITN